MKGEEVLKKDDFKKKEVVEEEEVKGQTLEEYLAEKKLANIKKEGRKPEESKKTNIERVEEEKDKIHTLNKNLRNAEIYNAGSALSEHNVLLGF